MKATIVVGLLVVLAALFAWAWRAAPGHQASAQFARLWRERPWGPQLIVDFFALEILLALWMVDDASARGAWMLVVPCLVAMPVFGAMPAAVYWLLR